MQAFFFTDKNSDLIQNQSTSLELKPLKLFACHSVLKTSGTQAPDKLNETADLNTAVKKSLCPAVSKYGARPWQQLNATVQVEHILPTGTSRADLTKCQRNVYLFLKLCLTYAR